MSMKFITVKEWKERLSPRYREALEECCGDDRETLSPREALDVIVNYEGGIASGYQIICLVNELWGGQLPDAPTWVDGKEA